VKVAIITGSGTEALASLRQPVVRRVDTPFGAVELTTGRLGDVEVVHLSRHGKRHERLSSHVNHRANITALSSCAVDVVLAVTVCGGVDPALDLGVLVVFDELYFPSNRLPDGSLCTLHVTPGAPGRGHWIFERPFSQPLRLALAHGATVSALPVCESGCYGHVDGPRFNSRAEIRALRAAGVSAVSQTAGPETVLAGEAQLPYALLGYVTDHANGVAPEATPIEELMRLLQASTSAFERTLAAAVEALERWDSPLSSTGTLVTFD
jgi:purine nucleoside phosphorylase